MVRALPMGLELPELDLPKLWVLDWSQLALFALVLLGLTYLVGWSRISFGTRHWLARRPIGLWLVQLIECPKCLGFHLGWVALMLGWGPFAGAGPWRWLVQPIVGSALMLIADRCDLFQHEAIRDRHQVLDQAELERNAGQAAMTGAIKSMAAAVRESPALVVASPTDLFGAPNSQEKKS